MALLIFWLVVIGAEVYFLWRRPRGAVTYVTTERIAGWSSFAGRQPDGYVIAGKKFHILRCRQRRCLILLEEGGMGWIEKDKGYRRQ